MHLSKNRFIALWLCSAAIVVLARVFNAADLGYDLTLQIQAAQNLLNGNGLSIYSFTVAEDFAKPATLLTLTHFPAGYSFCAAALMAMGFSLGGVLKATGAAGTILGWWGWAKLGYPFFSTGLTRGQPWRWAASAIAVSSPLLFTPLWKGTDIFLWAAVPWILGWVVKASDENAPHRAWFDWLAGAMCGLCILMRYASVFLVAYTGFLILCQSKVSLRSLAGRWAAFAAGLLPMVAIQVYLNYFISNTEATPGGLTLRRGLWAVVGRFWDGLWLLTSANFAVVWWMPQKLIEFLTQSGKQAPWLLGVTFAVFALPLCLAMRLKCHSPTAASRDVRIAAAGLFVVIPVFLWVCMIFGDYAYAADLRYYLPVLPLAVFVAYALAVANREHDEGKTQRLARIISLGYLLGYLVMAATGVALLVLPIEQGSGKRMKLMGTSEIAHWPSMKVTYEFSAAREYVVALLKDKPDTVLITNRENWFYADPAVNRSRIRRIEPCEKLQASYVSGPAHILITASDLGGPLQELHWFSTTGKPLRVDCFETLPDLHLLTKFPDEKVKILETWIPDGSRVFLNGAASAKAAQ